MTTVETKKVDVKKATDYLETKLYKFQKTAKALTTAWNSAENIILFGSGGYGKSVGAEMFGYFLKDQGVIDTDIYVLSFNQGITEEKIFGGMDVKKFQDTGEIIYLLEKAFVNYEYVIFEELFDAFPSVLLSLKDTLTSGFVRNGNQLVPIKTKMIVGCTNRTREEVVTDLSTEALMQRFVIEHEVKWETYELNDYKNAFKFQDVLNDITEVVAEMVVDVNKSKVLKYNVSPRTAVKAANVVLENDGDYTCLEFFHGFSATVNKFRAIIEQRKKDIIKVIELKNYTSSYLDLVNEINTLGGVEASKERFNDKLMELAILRSELPKSNDATTAIVSNLQFICESIYSKFTSNPIVFNKVEIQGKLVKNIVSSTSIESMKKSTEKLYESLR